MYQSSPLRSAGRITGNQLDIASETSNDAKLNRHYLRLSPRRVTGVTGLSEGNAASLSAGEDCCV